MKVNYSDSTFQQKKVGEEAKSSFLQGWCELRKRLS